MSHYYDKKGNPRHFEAKNGKPTTLREARKFDLYPSVTTIGQVRAKPALINWLQEQAALEAVSVENIAAYEAADFDAKVAWARNVIAQAREKTFAKADEGSAIHDALECWVTGQDAAIGEYLPICHAVDDLLKEHTGAGRSGDWNAEISFTNTELGYAGKCDLYNDKWVIDFKTKDGDVTDAKAYPDQAEQLAAYAYGLGVPNARLANIFISRDDGSVSFYEHKDPQAWNRFYHTLLLWQVVNKFGPLYEATLPKEAA